MLLAAVCTTAAMPAGAAPDAAACQAAIAAVERTSGVPPQLLSAIARVESGRVTAAGTVAWPWTLNVAGNGLFFESAGSAILAIEAARAAGTQSIDVGCMQVNLMHHPAAFASLQQALDPVANVTYAARFLVQLHAETGTWPKAAAAYHSRTPERAEVYGRRVMRAWPLAAAYGGDISEPAPTASAAVVDPYGVYTPAFAQRMRAEAAARAARSRSRLADSASLLPRSSLLQRFPSQLRTQVQRGGVRIVQADRPSTTRMP